MLLSVAVVWLPEKLVRKVKTLRLLRSQVQVGYRRFGDLLVRSPVIRFCIYLGKKGFAGRLATRCRQPSVFKVSSRSCRQIIASWTPRLPSWNIFHEEHYVYALRKDNVEGQDGEWQEKVFAEDSLDERPGKALRAFIDELSSHTSYKLRVCAENARGRSPWTEEVAVETLARPKDGGYRGPLGPAGAASGSKRLEYRWTQKRGEVGLKLPIPADMPVRDIRLKAFNLRIEILHVPLKVGEKKTPALDSTVPPPPEQVLLAGAFPHRIKPDEVFWEVEENDQDGRHLAVQLAKAEAMDKWDCFIEAAGHPHIDAAMVRIYTQDMDGLGKGGIDIFE